jgi:hypothetical protein
MSEFTPLTSDEALRPSLLEALVPVAAVVAGD